MKSSEIAVKLGGELTGDPDLEIDSISDLNSVADGELAFLASEIGTEELSRAPRGACILVGFEPSSDLRCTAIRVAEPKLAFARIASEIIPPSRLVGRHESAVIAENAVVEASYIGANVSIGEGARIGAGAVLHDGVRIGANATVGERSTIYPNAVVFDNCELGSGCVLHPGSIIGAEGFGFVRNGDELFKFPQIGRAVLEDNVEIGANTCIDRGALGETRIGADTKIDNLVQVAHNVLIGKRVLIAAQVGISGSVVIEDDVILGGQVGIGDHATIKSGAVIGGGSGIFSGKIVRAGFWAGKPVRPIKKYKEQLVLINSLAQFKKEIIELREKMD